VPQVLSYPSIPAPFGCGLPVAAERNLVKNL
jgi:hypothetical protein